MKVLSKRLLNRGSQIQNSRKPKPAIKNITKPKPKLNPSKTAFKEAKAEAKASNFWMLGSQSRPGSRHFCKKPSFRKPKAKPASNPTLMHILMHHIWNYILHHICIIYASYGPKMGQKSGPKTQKLDKSGILPVFNSFWPKKGVKCFSIWISRPDLEFSHHLAILGPHLLLFSHFEFLALPR